MNRDCSLDLRLPPVFVAHFVAHETTAHGGRHGRRSPARVAGGFGGLFTAAALTRWWVCRFCGNRKCDLRPPATPPALGARCWGAELGEKTYAKQGASPRGSWLFRYVFSSARHHAPQGWWAGCPFVGPIRGCNRTGVPTHALTQHPMRTQNSRPRAWAREGIPGPPAQPNYRPRQKPHRRYDHAF